MNKSKHTAPPKWILSFFRWFCHPDYAEDIEGDLLEKYDRYWQQHGKRKSHWLFLRDVLSLFRISLIRPVSFHQNLIHPAMLKQNLKIGYRNLLKNKTYSFIKIGGLALGITTFLLIALFIKDELSFDQHYLNGDRIYRVVSADTNPIDPGKGTAFPAEIGAVLSEKIPEIEKVARLIPYDWFLAGNNQIRRTEDKQNNYEEGFAYADPALLDILEIPMVYGNQKNALAKPNTIVLSEKMANKYFPNEDPIGQTIILNEDLSNPIEVGGVMENFPSTSHLQFDFLLTLKDVEFWPGEQTNWCCWNYNPYIRVKPGTDIAQLEKKLLIIRDDYLVPHFRKLEDPYADEAKKYLSIEVHPVSDIYLKSSDIEDVFKKSDIRIIQLFGAIAIFILLLACINFINLFTAKSANRAKEVGVRKVVGSFRSNLIQQFLTESTLFSGISVLIGLLLAFLALPWFNTLAGKSLHIPWVSWWFLPFLFLLTLLVGLLAGTYPSFYLSSFNPITVLKGKISQGSKNSKLRSSMVVFQFTTSIVLVISAFVVYNQMQFILHKKLGFEKEQVLLIKGANTLDTKLPLFKNALLDLSEIENVTSSNFLPVSGTKRDGNTFWIDGRSKIDRGVGGQAWRVDENYIPTMKMNLLQGRLFSKEMASDSSAVIINQTMAKKLGLEDPVGTQIYNWQTWNVIGVVEDFHFESIKGGIGPLVFFYQDAGSIVSARIQSEDMSEAIASISSVWDKFMPNQPIRYSFLDESYARMYADVQRTRNLFITCAGLAILIACLGLFGLSTFMTEQRSKEVSIRKILGASVSSVFQLLTINYIKLILISILISIPIAWYAMQSWLSGFENKIDLAWWFFIAAGFIVTSIAMLTVSRQALKLSFSNPSDFLRNE